MEVKYIFIKNWKNLLHFIIFTRKILKLIK